jgi:hypothetical protein
MYTCTSGTVNYKQYPLRDPAPFIRQFTSGQLDQQRIPQIRVGCSRIPKVRRGGGGQVAPRATCTYQCTTRGITRAQGREGEEGESSSCVRPYVPLSDNR